jgi:hypothetical protein
MEIGLEAGQIDPNGDPEIIGLGIMIRLVLFHVLCPCNGLQQEAAGYDDQ